MNIKLIIGLFILLCALSTGLSGAYAQKDDKMAPATHLWLQNFENLLFVPVRTVQQCENFVRQASNLNSSEGLCYLNNELVKRVECKKPLKRNGEPTCS
ncbi:MAG: hypothetical protein AAF204_04885 [Pseudomonadota bacterium]